MGDWASLDAWEAWLLMAVQLSEWPWPLGDTLIDPERVLLFNRLALRWLPE